MVGMQTLKQNLYTYLSAFSSSLVLYDELGTRVMDVEKPFVKIWLNDMSIFVQILKDNDDTKILLTIVGDRKLSTIRSFIDGLREFANQHMIGMEIKRVEQGSTPSKLTVTESNSIDEAWHDVDLSQIATNFGGWKVLKHMPKLPNKKDNILVPIYNYDLRFGSAIADTSDSIYSMLTDTTQALSDLTERFEKQNYFIRKK